MISLLNIIPRINKMFCFRSYLRLSATRIMSWVRESNLTWFQLLAVRVLKTGHIPKHIAIIMDGNRRYAKKVKAEKALQGHTKGFDKLSETLQWCLDLGISEVTVYAFSIENFKRSKEEVDDLMNLMRQKFQQLLNESEKLAERGVRIRVLGNLSLLPIDVHQLIAESMEVTRNNNKAFLNVALSYTSRDEITRSIKDVAEGVKNDDLSKEDIDEDLLSKCMDTEDSPVPDLLIRTSGEVRLSDFLTWQTTNTYIYFAQILWPEFCIWDLLRAILAYQRSYVTLKMIGKKHLKDTVSCNKTKNAYIHKLYNHRHASLNQLSKTAIPL